ncbi:unnamed protein product [Adineta ricciae]|uniref:Uncharacterized protein n=1 Tax=Adineta ricciae TaxID=249248 RepID=A0A814IAT0_ADIRI|nr:unnamed protein product [Adineta ricciae]
MRLLRRDCGATAIFLPQLCAITNMGINSIRRDDNIPSESKTFKLIYGPVMACTVRLIIQMTWLHGGQLDR